jgi:hypothetical protein
VAVLQNVPTLWTISNPEVSFTSTSGTSKKVKEVCIHLDPSLHFIIALPFISVYECITLTQAYTAATPGTETKKCTLLGKRWAPLKRQRAFTECLLLCKVFNKHKSETPAYWSNPNTRGHN